MLAYLATLSGANFIALALLLFLLVAGTTHKLFALAEWLSRSRRTDSHREHPKQ